MSKPANIVFIMTDTQGANAVGCYGRPELRTPCLDGLTAQGIRFDQAYTACPVCGPARSALFTGTYPHTNSSWGNDMPLGANVKTVGQRLHDHGYDNAYIGKWHLSGTDYFDNGICPPGWDPEYWYDGRCYLDELTDAERLRWRQELNCAEGIHRHGMTAEFTWAHRSSDRAIDFLSKQRVDPFFLVVSYDEPHGPFTCPPPYCDMFEGFEYQLADNVADPMTNKPEHQREWVGGSQAGRSERTLTRPMYFGCNSFVDSEIGRVLQAVNEFAPDALVIYTSDHGTPLLSHGLNSKGPAMYEETTRIPFLVRWPGQAPENAVCPYPVSHIDVTPTILAAAGLETPPFLEGESMLSTFCDPSRRPNREVFIEFNRYEVDHDGWGGFQPIRCAFDGRYKFIVNLHSSDELYDLDEDPLELDNRIESPACAAVRDRLHDAVLEWMDRTRDPFRGPVWERRPWRDSPQRRWAGPTRPRPDDGYEPRVLLYQTGMPVEKWEYENG